MFIVGYVPLPSATTIVMVAADRTVDPKRRSSPHPTPTHIPNPAKYCNPSSGHREMWVPLSVYNEGYVNRG